MKRKNTFIMFALSVILILLIVIFSTLGNKVNYYLTNESGDRKVMKNLKLVLCQDNYKKVKLGENVCGVISINNNKNLYFKLDGKSENKDNFAIYNVEDDCIKNDKIFCSYSMQNENDAKPIKTMIKVFDYKTGNELYSADIMKKKFFDKEAHAEYCNNYELSNK